MKRVLTLLLAVVMAASVWAMPLGTSARGIIPSEIQQVISVDYRALKNSETAMVMKQQVLPDSLKQRVESAAAREGASVNTWLVQAMQRAVEPRRPSSLSSSRNRLTGYGRS